MAFTFQFRRDTATNWSARNPVLNDGEPGYDKTNGVLKFGDGVTPWNSLQTAFRTQSYGDTTYAAAGTVPNYGRAVYTNTAAVTAPWSVAVNGIEGPTVATPVGALAVELEEPAEAAVTSTTWQFWAYDGTNAPTQIGADFTILGLRLRGVVNGLTWTWQPNVRLYLVCTSVQGGSASSFLGQAVTVRVAFGAGATIPTGTGPATPTLTATNKTDRVTLAIGLPAACISGLLIRDGLPYRDLPRSVTTFDDLLGTGETHTYQLAARGTGILSALTAAVTGTTTGGGGGGSGTGTTYTGFTAGATSPNGFGPLIVGTGGTTPTTAPSDTMADVNGVRALVSTTGSTGAQNKSDDLGREFNSDTAAHTPWDVSYRYGYDVSTGQFDLGVTANHLASAWTLTSGVFIRVQPDGITPLIKSTAAGSVTFNGTTSAISANSTLLLAKQALSGITADATHDYAVRVASIANADGTITVRIYHGTTTQLSTNSLPQVGSDIVINAAAAAGIPAGYHWYHVYGKQGVSPAQTGSQQTRLATYSIKAG